MCNPRDSAETQFWENFRNSYQHFFPQFLWKCWQKATSSSSSLLPMADGVGSCISESSQISCLVLSLDNPQTFNGVDFATLADVESTNSNIASLHIVVALKSIVPWTMFRFIISLFDWHGVVDTKRLCSRLKRKPSSGLLSMATKIF